MDKTKIKNFAIWARNKLIADIQYKASLMGITSEKINNPLSQSTRETEFYDIGTSEPYALSGDAIKQHRSLVDILEQKTKETNYKTAYKYVIEEVAYTWFNRLIAIRFMEVNDYLPSHIRVLSSESRKMEPDIVSTPFDAELNLKENEKQEIIRLKNENKPDLYKEIDGVNYILEEHADEMVDMELTRQLWEHIELVSKKLNISEEEAGKIFDIDDEKELLCLKFHAFTMDTIEQAAEDVIKKYAKKQAAEKKKTAAKKKTTAKKTAAKERYNSRDGEKCSRERI